MFHLSPDEQRLAKAVRFSVDGDEEEAAAAETAGPESCHAPGQAKDKRPAD